MTPEPEKKVLMHGTIGVARRVHKLVEFRRMTGFAWGVSRCGWAGMAYLTPSRAVTCAACQPCVPPVVKEPA